MISVVILTKNEEKNIKECLKTLEWCDEIVVADDFSEDKTAEIIQNYNSKVKIFENHLDQNFANQRNFGLEKASGEWVLFVDADERVTPQLEEEISKLKLANSSYKGFYIKREDFLFGKRLEHGETGNIKLLRLARKDSGNWERPVHETWEVKGLVGELTNPLLHYSHQSISEFLTDINLYTDINSKEFYKKGEKSGLWQIIFYPLAKFFKNYFFLFGFLDGLEGVIMATMMSFHSFLTRAKLWLLWHSI